MNTTAITIFRRRLRAFIGRPILLRQKSFVTFDSIEYCQNPIIVMGCHRSGTSLLRRILNSHKNIACPPETNYLLHFIRMLQDDNSISGLSGMMDTPDIKPEVARLAFRFHEAFRLDKGKARWADKTPQYVPYYDQLMDLAPDDTQCVVIYRNPFDIASSIYDRGWRLEDLDDDLFINTCLYVKKTMEQLSRIANKENVYVLHYESLVEDPKVTTEALCVFLKETWDEGMIRPWDFDHNFGTEDPIARSQKNFKLSSNNWKALTAEQQVTLHRILGEISSDLGYQNK